MRRLKINLWKKYSKIEKRVKSHYRKRGRKIIKVSSFRRKYPKKPGERKPERFINIEQPFIKDKDAAKRDLACALK